MKAHLAKVSLAVLSTVLLLGCQDMGSGPVGLEGLGPEFAAPPCKGPNKNDPNCPGTTDTDKVRLLYLSPGVENTGYTCDGGAKFSPEDPTFGQVTWGNIRRQDNHIHGDITLSIKDAPGFVADRTYQIVGNQDALCGSNPSLVDFHLRHGHTTFRFIDNSGAREATIGLTFGSEKNPPIPAGHEPGTHQLWLTIRGPGVLWKEEDNPHRVGDVYHDEDGNLLRSLGGEIIPDSELMVLRSTAVVVVIKKHSGHP